MIQFNLLPDVKIEFLKARRRMRLVVTISIVSSAISILLFAALFSFVRIAQVNHSKAVSRDIIKGVEQLRKDAPELDKILTVQNQLKSLPELHDNKAISSRLFDYLFQLTPDQATISDVELDLEANTILVKGNSDSFGTVNKYADTLKLTDYMRSTADKPEGKAFSNVVLQKFSVIEQRSGVAANAAKVEYEILASFDPIIFSNIKGAPEDKPPITLVIPNIISARSIAESPGSLFAPQQNIQPNQGGGR
ncbi:MAG: hypothetical protein ACR2FM_04475 [Candidatus Saccharimonadales bacterium]